MARIVGLDYGRKRIGIAVTDPMQMIASPLKTIPIHEVVCFLKHYTATNTVESIVIGWPLQLNGKVGITANLVIQFTRLLKRYFPNTPIVHHDERFTSVMAQRSLLLAGVKKQKRRDKTRLDAISAALILQSFMAHKEHSTN